MVGLGAACVSLHFSSLSHANHGADALSSFAIWMVFGAIITKIWVPNPCNIWGQSRSLEDLGLGKAARKRMEKDERDAWRAMVPGSPHEL